MKIRTDFVTNSSSSSFTLLLKVYDKGGNEYKYTTLLPPQLQMLNWLPESTRAEYRGSLEAVAKCKDTRTLAETLINGVDNGLMDDVNNVLADSGLYYDEDRGKILPDEECDEDFDEDEVDEEVVEEAGMVIRAIEEARNTFIKAVSDNIPRPEDIARIVVERDYYAWGEYAEMLAYNDSELRQLLEAYAKAVPEKKAESKQALLSHIHAPEIDVEREQFGVGFPLRYLFDDTKLDALAALKLSTNESGTEYQILDMDKGTVERYAEYEIEVEE